ncbi:MAG TPA: aminoacyl-tRNA hydrolase [Verrucomicrobiae bacterium]|nr:aminoacyl-tRNA hydrolase [Verrucomicrobiae bacterium]
MTLIIGLGNPGTDYTRTRHNVGFFMLDALAEKHRLQWQEKPKFKALIAEYTHTGGKSLLIKPTTFYNNSGEAARAVMDFYKIETSHILAIHDELVLPLGTVRTRKGGSDAGNNGIKSLNQHLGLDYTRIRVGVWQEQRNHTDDRDFVLGKFSSAELEKLHTISDYATDAVEDFIKLKTLPATTWKLGDN